MIHKLFASLDHRPSIGYFSSLTCAGIGYCGHLMAEVMPAHTLEQVPRVVQWLGYVTILFSCIGAILTAGVQFYRFQRERRGLSSRDPFDRLHRKPRR